MTMVDHVDAIVGNTLKLTNGVELTITDVSKVIAKGAVRVEVVFSARAAADFSLLSQIVDLPGVMEKIGKEVELCYRQTRAFVMKEEEESVKAALIAAFNANTLPYIAIPDFPKKLTQARYKDLLRQNLSFKNGAVGKRGW